MAWAGEADTLQGRPSRLRALAAHAALLPTPSYSSVAWPLQSPAPLAEQGPWPGPQPPATVSDFSPAIPGAGFGPWCPQFPGPLSPPSLSPASSGSPTASLPVVPW